MGSGTVIGALITGILLLAGSLLVPIVTRRANKATDASESAKKSAETAKLYTDSAIALVGGVEKQLADANKKCDACLGELAGVRRREARLDRVLTAVHAALLEMVPLFTAGAAETEMLRATINTVAQARYDDED